MAACEIYTIFCMFWQAPCHHFTVVAAAGSKIGRERSLRGSPWERTRYLSQACTGPETSFFVHLEYVFRSPAEPALATGRFRPKAVSPLTSDRSCDRWAQAVVRQPDGRVSRHSMVQRLPSDLPKP